VVTGAAVSGRRSVVGFVLQVPGTASAVKILSDRSNEPCDGVFFPSSRPRNSSMSPRPHLAIVPALTPPPASLARPASSVERSDEELMVAAGGGSRPAFELLARRYLGRVASYCAKVTGDRQAADELAQEVFLQIWLHRATYRPARPFAVFLFSAARNRCLNHRRWWRLRRHSSLDEGGEAELAGPAASGGGQLDALLDAERRRRVHEAIGRLTPRLREAVLLRYEQGLDHRAIAAVVGCPVATARTRVWSGMQKLRAELGEVVS
jgi:RNA polymerase sigma-70 factor (ECF subfamily)